MKLNPRYQNGSRRRKNRARFKAMNAPCGICHGRLGPIHYDEPSDSKHPLSFVIDEIKPISRYKEFGYSSPRQAAEDWENLQAAHYICNQMKSNKTSAELRRAIGQKRTHCVNVNDGDW
jgi:5-methylcytosine-specific restriction endonuclease McrA